MGIIGELRDALERAEVRIKKLAQLAYDIVFAGKLTREEKHEFLRKIDRLRDDDLE